MKVVKSILYLVLSFIYLNGSTQVLPPCREMFLQRAIREGTYIPITIKYNNTVFNTIIGHATMLTIFEAGKSNTNYSKRDVMLAIEGKKPLIVTKAIRSKLKLGLFADRSYPFPDSLFNKEGLQGIKNFYLEEHNAFRIIDDNIFAVIRILFTNNYLTSMRCLNLEGRMVADQLSCSDLEKLETL